MRTAKAVRKDGDILRVIIRSGGHVTAAFGLTVLSKKWNVIHDGRRAEIKFSDRVICVFVLNCIKMSLQIARRAGIQRKAQFSFS